MFTDIIEILYQKYLLRQEINRIPFEGSLLFRCRQYFVVKCQLFCGYNPKNQSATDFACVLKVGQFRYTGKKNSVFFASLINYILLVT